MREVQNPRRVWRVEVNKALYPFGAITHTCNLLGAFEPSAVQFAERQALKPLSFGHSREVRMAVCRNDCFAVEEPSFSHFAQHQRLDFSPFTLQNWYEG